MIIAKHPRTLATLGFLLILVVILVTEFIGKGDRFTQDMNRETVDILNQMENDGIDKKHIQSIEDVMKATTFNVQSEIDTRFFQSLLLIVFIGMIILGLARELDRISAISSGR
ncbi:MAG: hypothetical protein J5I65_17130 [Aridibacter famidurans]|nr:hypothetical protein [Aridibacter famidurans]